MPVNKEKVYNRRVGPGEVRLGPRNFLSKSPPKGSMASNQKCLFGSLPPYESDEYEAERKQANLQRQFAKT